MSLFHAVVWIDHHNAQVLQFDAEQVQASKIHAHTHHTRQHGSTVRTEHEFFAEVCAALSGVGEVLITGSKTSQADFHHYVSKHRPALAPRIAGYESVDQPTQNQLVAMARKFFLAFDQKSGAPKPAPKPN